MREVTERRRTADLVGAMACDFELFHLEADVKWIEHSARRLDAKRGRRTKGEDDGTES
jgi:hypothetical protein